MVSVFQSDTDPQKQIFYTPTNIHYAEYSAPFYNWVLSFKLEFGC